MTTITGTYDTDLYLLNFLAPIDIYNLLQVSRDTNNLIANWKIYQKLVDVKNIYVKKYHTLYYFNKNNIIDNISGCGYFHLLEWLFNLSMDGNSILMFKNLDYEYKYTKNAINLASRNGHISVLEWFKNSGYIFKYTVNAIDWASLKGHIAVLKWFKNSKYEFKYTKNAIDWASSNGHTSVLEWFKNSGLEFKYTSEAIDCASRNGHISVLEWFKNSGLEFKYTENAIYEASRNSHIAVLEWLKNSGLEFKYTRFDFYLISEDCNIAVLEWFKNSGLLNNRSINVPSNYFINLIIPCLIWVCTNILISVLASKLH